MRLHFVFLPNEKIKIKSEKEDDFLEQSNCFHFHHIPPNIKCKVIHKEDEEYENCCKMLYDTFRITRTKRFCILWLELQRGNLPVCPYAKEARESNY